MLYYNKILIQIVQIFKEYLYYFHKIIIKLFITSICLVFDIIDKNKFW